MKGSDTVIKRLFFTLELQTTLEIGIFSDSDSDAVEYFFCYFEPFGSFTIAPTYLLVGCVAQW